MQTELTPEQVTKLGREWGKIFLSSLTIEERLAGIEPKEVLSHFAPEERLAGVEAKEVLSHFAPEELEEYLRSLKQSPPRKHQKKVNN